MLSNFTEAFVKQAEAALAAYPHLHHEWRRQTGEVKLVFPPAGPEGFEVWALASDAELIVGGEGAHHHFEYDDGPHEDAIAAALGLVRDLLSPTMRVREYLAGASAYRGVLEAEVYGEWHAEEESGSIFYNWFAPGSERVLQNHHLPPRAIVG